MTIPTTEPFRLNEEKLVKIRRIHALDVYHMYDWNEMARDDRSGEREKQK